MLIKEKVKSIQGEVSVEVWDRFGNPKLLFQPNKLWEILKRWFNLDVQIEGITGFKSYSLVKHNDITTIGKSMIAQGILLSATYMAIGTGTPTSTELGSEIVADGGERAIATQSQITTDTTDDTAQWVNLFVLSAPYTITEEGLFDGADPGDSNMLTSWTMPGLGLVATDSVQLTHRIKVEQAV